MTAEGLYTAADASLKWNKNLKRAEGKLVHQNEELVWKGKKSRKTYISKIIDKYAVKCKYVVSIKKW